MSMLSQLKDLWRYQDRIKHLEACNAILAESRDRNDAERVRFRRERDAADRDLKLAIAERDATAKSLEETMASLIDARRQHGKLNEEFDRLAAMFREKVDDLRAAEELLDEAGEQIDTLRWTRDTVIAVLGERSVKLDQIAELARR